jgi:hypothetical protein
MYKTKLSRLSVIAGCILLLAVLSFISCKTKEQRQREINKELYGENSRRADSLMVEYEKQKTSRDSIIQILDISGLYIKRDAKGAGETLKPDSNGRVSLCSIYGYFEYLHVSEDYGIIWTRDIVKNLMQYCGFKTNSMASWQEAMKKMIEKFQTALNDEDKKVVIKSLRYSSNLVSLLNRLSARDQKELMNTMDTIVYYQSKNPDWIYTKWSTTTLKKEYNLLAKVWTMPKLVEDIQTDSNMTVNPYGYMLFLGNTNNLNSEEKWDRVWNTRYINEYQYIIGLVHRRVLDAKGEEINSVIQKVASLMNEAVNMLQ